LFLSFYIEIKEILMRRLKPLVKNYEWGMDPSTSTARFFVDGTDEKIAEIWWGHPHVEILDSHEKIEIPYLLKMLFVEKPLSLQVHPTTKQLSQYPCFKDSFPKPEIIVAITDFEALCGFLPEEKVWERISNVPFLCQYRDFSRLFHAPDIENVLRSAKDYAEKNKHQSHLSVFLSLLELYPSDAATLCPFYMNHVCLKKDQALIIPASQPHCYLSGQGVECMPPSDNIVRCGLTRKQCDLDLFFKISNRTEEAIVANEPFHHEELDRFFKLCIVDTQCFCPKNSIFLVIDGEGIINNEIKTRVGDSWIVETDTEMRFSGTLKIVVANPNK